MADICDLPGAGLRVAPDRVPDPAQDSPIGAGASPAVLAGGCFWCVEAVFRELAGVLTVESGYCGGLAADAQYARVCSGDTEHAEAIRIVFEEKIISYGLLLKIFLTIAHDPTQHHRQGHDIGPQYRSAIFYANPAQQAVAAAYLRQLAQAGVFARPLCTSLEPLPAFYPAEAAHQAYAARHPAQPYIVALAQPKCAALRRYFPALLSARRSASGYDLGPLAEPTRTRLVASLSPQARHILLDQGTEPAFCGSPLQAPGPGLYACALCGLPLFAAAAKFESGTGWPSFTQPFDPAHLREIPDHRHGLRRTEIRCTRCDGHLGHVFADGPPPGGRRYCLNSAALDFVAAS